MRLPLHDFFIAKSLDALKAGGILAVVTSHYTLDKQNASTREYLAERADFLGAIRLPSNAFKREGTSVVTDIVFLRKRAAGEPARHADPAWLETAPLSIEGTQIPINRYFLNHPGMVLGSYSRQDRLYDSTYSLAATGDLSTQLKAAISTLPDAASVLQVAVQNPSNANSVLQLAVQQVSPAAFTPPPVERHITEGSFFVGNDRTIHQVEGGQSQPVVDRGTQLKANGTMTGKRLAAPGFLTRPRPPRAPVAERWLAGG